MRISFITDQIFLNATRFNKNVVFLIKLPNRPLAPSASFAGSSLSEGASTYTYLKQISNIDFETKRFIKPPPGREVASRRDDGRSHRALTQRFTLHIAPL